MTELQDGLHLGLDFASYLKQPRIGKSTLMAHRRTAAHAQQDMLTVKEQTAAMRLGSMVHTLVLEPHEWNLRYAVGPDAARNTKVWKEWAEAQPEGRELIKPDEFETAQNMAGFVHTKTVIGELLREPGPVESSVFWTDNGIPLRARPDKIVSAKRLLIDLKTTTDLSDHAITSKIYSMGYHLQLALYMEGLESVGHGCESACLIWVETAPPYEARAMILSDDWLDIATQELADLKRRHAACMKSGKWPGYPDKIVESPLPPRWALDDGADFTVRVGNQDIAA